MDKEWIYNQVLAPWNEIKLNHEVPTYSPTLLHTLINKQKHIYPFYPVKLHLNILLFAH